ncbi:MAG: hypothetical protein R6U88_02200 [Candidatus Bipolaricaulota bacterium]
MTMENPLRLILIGFVCVVSSWAALFLMVMELLPSPLSLSVGAYCVSTAGLFLGLLGGAGYVRERRGTRE